MAGGIGKCKATNRTKGVVQFNVLPAPIANMVIYMAGGNTSSTVNVIVGSIPVDELQIF